MGADGPGLFSDDTACDVRDAYPDAVADGASAEAARDLVLTAFAEALDDPDEVAVFWLALAHTQSKLGRLDDQTLRTALAILDSGADVDRWRAVGEKAARARSAALDRVRQQLVGPQPAPRRVRRPARPVSSLSEGEVLGYRARSGRIFLVRVAAMIDTAAQRSPLIRILDYAERALPSPEGLAAIPDIADTAATDAVVIESARERPADHGFEVIGRVPGSSEPGRDPDRSCGWPAISSWFMDRDGELNRLGFSPYFRSGQDA
ncbi:hypothetical protein [Pseudonocardia sp. TRM90224]|uniref:hypothetical protein n=1 Tax=Pseudonocardia sp. TRM90224 TaxID=2812678 RepID=UPI001E506802|nr:hypothetical protein [Pseudonocardia sp. TRM90224]